jgi:hypothetical protein
VGVGKYEQEAEQHGCHLGLLPSHTPRMVCGERGTYRGVQMSGHGLNEGVGVVPVVAAGSRTTNKNIHTTNKWLQCRSTTHTNHGSVPDKLAASNPQPPPTMHTYIEKMPIGSPSKRHRSEPQRATSAHTNKGLDQWDYPLTTHAR